MQQTDLAILRPVRRRQECGAEEQRQQDIVAQRQGEVSGRVPAAFAAIGPLLPRRRQRLPKPHGRQEQHSRRGPQPPPDLGGKHDSALAADTPAAYRVPGPGPTEGLVILREEMITRGYEGALSRSRNSRAGIGSGRRLSYRANRSRARSSPST